MLQFVEPDPELKSDPCAELRRRGLDCTEEVEAARQKAPESRTIFVNGLLAAGLALLAAAAVIWVPFLEPIRDRFADTEPGWVVAAFVLQLLSVLSFVVALRGAFERRLGWRESFDVGVVEESANVFLPSGGSGGLALGAVILIRSGIPSAFAASRSAVLFLVTSAVSGGALIVFGLLEAGNLLPGDAALTETLIPGLAGALHRRRGHRPAAGWSRSSTTTRAARSTAPSPSPRPGWSAPSTPASRWCSAGAKSS